MQRKQQYPQVRDQLIGLKFPKEWFDGGTGAWLGAGLSLETGMAEPQPFGLETARSQVQLDGLDGVHVAVLFGEVNGFDHGDWGFAVGERRA